jgi:hypothetical protein
MNDPTSQRLTAQDARFFREGTHRRLYERMGCQLREGWPAQRGSEPTMRTGTDDRRGGRL